MAVKQRTELWMCGGGVQSSAVAALIVQGKIRPNLAVIVDTEREQSTTWAYMDAVTAPALASVGVTLHRVLKSRYATVDVFGGKEGILPLIPAFTTQGGEIGKLTTFCSNEWKRRVARRWATKEHGVTAATCWVGFSTDELARVPKTNTGKWQDRFPLIEQKMNRGDCIALVKHMGWPEPPRSSCWMCPNHTQAEWRDIRDNKPRDWKRAVLFDRWLRMYDQHAYIHADAVPLDQADLDDKNETLFGRCESGMCFT